MSQPLIDMLLGCPEASTVGLEALSAVTNPASGKLGVLFLTGDPSRLNETGDVAVVLQELNSVFAGKLIIGVVTQEEQRDVMREVSVFALPSISLFHEGKCLKTLPKIQDWPVYIEAFEEALGQVSKRTEEMA